MRARCLAALAVILMVAGATRTAIADPKGDVAAKIKAAMESYDSLDYDGARKLLNQALATAKKAKLDKDPIVAKAYLDLGIVAFAVPDLDAAKLSFLSAVQIEPKIQIEVAYRSVEIAKLLDQARSEATSSDTGGGPGPSEPVGPPVDCSGAKGLDHTILDSGKAGVALPIEAKVGNDVKAAKVSVMYRPEGTAEFIEVKMTKQECRYTASIPAKAMKGGAMVHYYIAAYNEAGKPIASKGSQGSPNIIEVTGTAPAVGRAGDDEDPIHGKKRVADSGGGGGEDLGVTSNVTVGSHRQHVMLAVTGGYGFGYVTGTTEGMNTVKNCCIGQSPVVLIGELAYFANPQVAIGVAFRLGLPLGANVDGHATAAPGGLLRVHYALAPSGEGIHVMAQAGAGFLRNTIKLDNPMPGMDTDIVAQGPLLVGGGIGVTKHLTSAVAFVADLSALAGIAVVSQISGSPVNSGLSADLSLGFAVGF